jgi:chromosome segregation protein
MLEQSLRNIQDAWAQLENRQFLLESGDRVDVSALHDLEAQLEGLLASRLQDEEKLALVRREMEQVTQAIRQNETARHQMDARLQERRSALEALRMNQQALRINQDRLRREIEHDGFALPALLDEMPADSTTETFAELLTALADRVQRLGPINLAAIDEYQSQSERKEYLDRQHAELTEALATLQNAIRRIDRETRSKFKETYDQVNDGLQRLFPKIFGGGSASLSLTDDDLLETGVSILARPPGKKNATIHLLSGGEKALTALALIFAIFELNPAPFCMLDEVDAPLDDANVGRFANLVREMSRTVQFIYISHNKVSMEQADQLMGVTMLEPGVSRLVSVNVEEAAALVEA